MRTMKWNRELITKHIQILQIRKYKNLLNRAFLKPKISIKKVSRISTEKSLFCSEPRLKANNIFRFILKKALKTEALKFVHL